MATYEIIETLSGNPAKFSCKVSFNGKPAQYYEVEVPNDMGEEPVLDENGKEVVDKKGRVVMQAIPKPVLDAAYVDQILTKVAEEDALNNPSERASTPADSIKVVNGKVEVK